MNIAIFASGSGTNAENLINYFNEFDDININQIFCNNSEAGVIQRANKFNIATCIFNRENFYKSNMVLDKLFELKTDYIVLAGFLWLIPENLLQTFTGKIINIHPSLLPKYGGKGMYGMNVHNAVIINNEQTSGITIHLVNEKYDDGEILFQATCNIDESDTPQSLAEKIHELEYEHFPKVVEQYIREGGK